MMNASEATHSPTSAVLRNAAAGNETPMPVARARYAATHTGHLGSRARRIPGTIEPAISPPHRHRDADPRARSLARVLVWQQEQEVFTDV
jgi:hypothetical protein